VNPITAAPMPVIVPKGTKTKENCHNGHVMTMLEGRQVLRDAACTSTRQKMGKKKKKKM
jgi:hypothetical protein